MWKLNTSLRERGGASARVSYTNAATLTDSLARLGSAHELAQVLGRADVAAAHHLLALAALDVVVEAAPGRCEDSRKPLFWRARRPGRRAPPRRTCTRPARWWRTARPPSRPHPRPRRLRAALESAGARVPSCTPAVGAPPTQRTRTAWLEKQPDRLSASTLRHWRHCTTCVRAKQVSRHSRRGLHLRRSQPQSRTMRAASGGISCCIGSAAASSARRARRFRGAREGRPKNCAPPAGCASPALARSTVRSSLPALRCLLTPAGGRQRAELRARQQLLRRLRAPVAAPRCRARLRTTTMTRSATTTTARHARRSALQRPRDRPVIGSSSPASLAASPRRLTARARGVAGAPDEAAPHAHDARPAHQV